MAILKVKFDNFLCFDDFEANFTYPKKLVNSPIEGEFLLNYPSIRYKKVNILIGSNATGKTSLGKAIWLTLMFLRDKEAKPIRNAVSNNNKQASILIDCAFKEGLFFRFEVMINPDGNILARYRELLIQKDDTYENLVKKLPNTNFDNYVNALQDIGSPGWYFCFPTIEDGFDFISCKYDNENDKKGFAKVFSKILKTFDPTVDRVFPSIEQEDTFIIVFQNGNTVAVKHGEKLSRLDYLSSGTKYAINIAGVMYAIKKQNNGFYYVDEQFSYVNSDIEIACLSTMIELLGDGEQLFFTTHNPELMNISLPIHSFYFLKKTKSNEDNYKIEIVNASSFEKRNNVNVKNLYDNDYFDISPDTSEVYEIGD